MFHPDSRCKGAKEEICTMYELMKIVMVMVDGGDGGCDGGVIDCA